MVTYRSAEVASVMTGTPPNGDNGIMAPSGAGLVIEVDRQVVRAVLFDTVEGQGRFVAASTVPSTLVAPIADAAVAIREVLRDIEEQSGMRLFGEAGEVASDALESVILTGQPANPVRVAVIPVGDHQLTSVLLGASRASLTVAGVLDESVRTEDGVVSGTLLERELDHFRPDIILLLAGDRAESEWPTAVGVLGSALQYEPEIQVIVLATEELQQYVIQTLGDHSNLTGLDPSQYQPHEVAAAVEIELHSQYDARIASAEISSLPADTTFVNRSRTGDLVTRFLARRREQAVAAVTVGDGTFVHWATPSESAMSIRPDMDVFASARAMLDLDGERVVALLSFSLTLEDLHNWVLNRALRPGVVADLRRDQLIESAVTSEIVRAAWSDLGETQPGQVALIVGGSAFARWDDLAVGVLSLLNAFEPTPQEGLVEIVLDSEGLLTTVGAIGEMLPAVAADAVEHDLLVPAASVIVVEGSGTDGEIAVRGRISYEDDESTHFSVPCGSMHRLPLADGEDATLTLTCEAGFSIGGNEPGEEVEFGQTRRLRGGGLGVVIDARGRPMPQSQDARLNSERVANWYADLGFEMQRPGR